MKKIFSTFTLLVFSMTAFSQIEFNPGVRVGLNLANFTNTETDAKKDLYIGAIAEIKLARFYALQPEVTYSRQGAKSKESSAGDIEINYLGLTIANKFSPFKDSGLHFIIGPSLNFKLDDNTDMGLEDFDFGLFGGLGYGFPFGLTLEARYNIGFVDVTGANINNTVAYDELFVNKVFQIGAAYKFDFRK